MVKLPVLKEKYNNSPPSSQRPLRKKTLNNLRELCELGGEILFKMASVFLKFHTPFGIGVEISRQRQRRVV